MLYRRRARCRSDGEINTRAAEADARRCRCDAIEASYGKHPRPRADRAGSESDVEDARAASANAARTVVGLSEIASDPDTGELETSRPSIAKGGSLPIAGATDQLIRKGQRADREAGICRFC